MPAPGTKGFGPMPLDLYLGFVLASAVLILIPGPNVTLLVANSLAYGARRALTTLAGTSSAIALQLVITALGMTSLMLVLAAWFEWLRWSGVLYLVYLGVQQWRAAPVALEDFDPARVAGRTLFWRGFLVSATNPKTLLFYAAFFPQFIDPAGAPLPQLLLMSATFFALATVLDGGYALLAGRLRQVFRGQRRARLRNRITGSLLIGAGLGLALARRQ
jgi:threonine/homoserine/homoserine lactone efflux protein